VRAQGFTCVLWNAVPRDWDRPEGWVETALAQIALQPWTLIVLHELPTGAMRHLDGFLAEVRRGGRFRQNFPPSCLPITAGAASGQLSDFVAEGQTFSVL
jgi:peptidoglycan-N-acetylglucosamine deacetylase